MPTRDSMDILEKFTNHIGSIAVPPAAAEFEQVATPLRLASRLQTDLLKKLQFTVLPMSAAEHAAAEYLDKPLGLGDATTARYLGALLASYALLAVVPVLPAGATRKLWTTLAGMAMVQFVFGIGYLHLFFTSAVSYVILGVGSRLFPRWAHLVSGVLVFAYLCMRHIVRENVNASSVDDAVLQMVLTIKLYSLGYTLFDGTTGAGNIQRGIESAKAKLASELSDRSAKATLNALRDRQQRGLKGLPDPLSFFAYVFNPGTVMCGPAFEYSVFIEGMDRPSLPTDTPRLIPVLVKFTMGLVTLAASAMFKTVFPVERLYDDALLVLSGAPHAPSLVSRVAYAWVAFALIRMQYYGVWKLAEGACVLGGFGYRSAASKSSNSSNSNGNGVSVFKDVEFMLGKDTLAGLCRAVLGRSYEQVLAQLGVQLSSSPVHSDWEGASNVAPLTVETRRSADEVVRVWNTNTQSWLERYIFKRAPRAGGLNKWLTFLASAFWHGFYSGYYLGFLTVPLMQDSTRALMDASGPVMTALGLGWLGTPQPTLLYFLTCVSQWALTQLSWMYVLTPFCLFEARKGIAVWASLGYVGHLVPLAMFVLAQVLRVVFPKRKDKVERTAAGVPVASKGRPGSVPGLSGPETPLRAHEQANGISESDSAAEARPASARRRKQA